MTETVKKNAFLEALTELRGGEALSDLEAAILSLVNDVRTIGKGGTLTLALKFDLSKGGAAIVVDDKITVKAPEVDRDSTIFYPDEQNHLTRRDPRQPKLPHAGGPTEMTADVRPWPMAVNDKPGDNQ